MNSMAGAAASNEQADAELLCAICLERRSGAILRPCGHDCFCHTCASRLRSCPLCRAPLLLKDNGQAQFAAEPISDAQREEETRAVVASRTVITEKEAALFQGIAFGVWLFIFIFGIVEHMHDLRQSCEGGDPVRGSGDKEWLSVENGSKACKTCSAKNDIDCDECAPGYYNLGTQCFKYLENFPPLTTGAALGGTIYFILIVTTQSAGIASELLLIRRLVRRKLMPRKELWILGCALFIEISRMFLVDIFVMQEYFGGRAYHIFRTPVPSPLAQCNGNSWADYNVTAWQGDDSQWYCDDVTSHSRATTYYIAARQDAWASEPNECSVFTTDSSLLNFDEGGMQDVPGHTRFKTMGWVIGGEFALYYFFATFINEVADNLFVVPTTTTGGWMCKVFSVALEVFQLGALCPAAVFTHKDCLHFTAPLGVSMGTMSGIVMTFGYFIWGFIVLCIPLAGGGAALLGVVLLICFALAKLAPLFRCAAQLKLCSRWPSYSKTMDAIADGLVRTHETMEQLLEFLHESMKKGFAGARNGVLVLAFLPMLCGGIFLGTLVVVGQGSKKGFMQVLTAIVLLSDVLFKVLATSVTEVQDYIQHRRVRRNVAGGASRLARGEVIGRPLACFSTGNDDDCPKKPKS
mmetsp:Transcript_127342/g.284013  ORF Transcript_127342/g.284013 Transcript_127342/m.284013 type:complete len:635 (-) Transcript_127342:19-1923(-)